MFALEKNRTGDVAEMPLVFFLLNISQVDL